MGRSRRHAAAPRSAVERALRERLRRDPDDHGAAVELGTLLASRGDAEGVERLRAAAARAPADRAAQNNLGHALRDAGALDEAAAVFEAMVAREPRGAPGHFGLGTVRIAQGRVEDAERAVARACALDGGFVHALRVWGDLLERMERHAASLEVRTRALAHDARHAPTLRKVGLLQARLGRTAPAIATLRQALALAPDDALVAHTLGALTGTGPDAADPAWVVELFDAYAERYDAHLEGALETRVPALIDAALPGPLGRVGDLGCGTGLVGVRLRGRANRLAGVDLSAAMVERARARGVYDALVVGPIDAWLPSAGPLDTLVLADVLGYVGALDALWAGLARALAPGGHIAATTEWHAGDGLTLGAHGRYAHGTALVDRVSASAGLRVVSRSREPLRREAGAWVEGELVVLARP